MILRIKIPHFYQILIIRFKNVVVDSYKRKEFYLKFIFYFLYHNPFNINTFARNLKTQK
jgi:hypothetical protein